MYKLKEYEDGVSCDYHNGVIYWKCESTKKSFKKYTLRKLKRNGTWNKLNPVRRFPSETRVK